MRVLVTGGTGSFGNAFINRLVERGLAERIVVLSRDEFKQSIMAEKFSSHPHVKFFLGDVRDRERLVLAMRGCDLVVAAAALKRIDQVSYDPEEVIKTNLLGTMNTVRAAMECGTKKVLFLSSDKSVLSANIYGGTKFLAEQYCVLANSYAVPGNTFVSAVRYGNVLDSRGSALHRFREQAKRGAPITVTDGRMTRFVMTLSRAVDLALLAVDHMRGGEVFIPRMPSMRILDLAEAVAPGWPVEFSGLRPGGEKLSEVLISEHESDRAKIDDDLGVYVLDPTHGPWGYVPWPGKKVQGGFRYESAMNEEWLGVEELRRLTENL